MNLFFFFQNAEKICFFIFVNIIIFCLLILLSIKNSFYCLIALIYCFLFTSFLMFLLNLDFLAVIYILIYIGAILVLFLFFVMILNIKEKKNMRIVNLRRFIFSYVFFSTHFYILLYLFEKNDYILFKNISLKEIFINFVYLTNIDWNLRMQREILDNYNLNLFYYYLKTLKINYSFHIYNFFHLYDKFSFCLLLIGFLFLTSIIYILLILNKK